VPEIPSGAHRFDVQSIFVVAFQCNNNLSALFYANTLPAGNISQTIPFRLSSRRRSRDLGSEFHLTVTSRYDHSLSGRDFSAQELHGQRVLNQGLDCPL
jgi:hypothetical protein